MKKVYNLAARNHYKKSLTCTFGGKMRVYEHILSHITGDKYSIPQNY